MVEHLRAQQGASLGEGFFQDIAKSLTIITTTTTAAKTTTTIKVKNNTNTCSYNNSNNNNNYNNNNNDDNNFNFSNIVSLKSVYCVFTNLF